MKKLSQSIALVAVTTLFATAFTTSYFEQHTETTAAITNVAPHIEQVVVTGKRMTALEKAQYDAEVVAQATTQLNKVDRSELKIAVK
jgi:hypothetical protein